MTKYNRISEPLRKAKQSAMLTEDIERANAKRLEDAYREKRRNDARDEELFKFGTDLFNAGYTLDDFILTINSCIENGYRTASELEATGWFLYDNIAHVPSFEKLVKRALFLWISVQSLTDITVI